MTEHDPNSDDPTQWRNDRVVQLLVERRETIENLGQLALAHSTLDVECGSRKIVWKGCHSRPTPELKELITAYLMRYLDEITVELALLGYPNGDGK